MTVAAHGTRRLGLSRGATAWSLVAVVGVMLVAFDVVFLTPITPAVVFSQAGGATSALFVTPYIAFALVGGLIASRRPENPIGWLILAGAGSIAAGALSDLSGSLLIHAHAAAGKWVALGGLLWSGGVSASSLCFLLAALLFPDGHLSSRRWRWVVYGIAALALLTLVYAATSPAKGVLGIGFSSDASVNATSPLAIAGLAGIGSAASTVLWIAPITADLLAVLSVLLRLRGATAERRHQVKWFAAGLATTVAFEVVFPSFLPSAANPGPLELSVLGVSAVIGGLAVPVTVAVAVLKYRLYDIDIIINRTLVYAALAAFITAVYIGIAVGIGTLVGSGGQPNLWLSIVATIIVAVGFQPLRERLQRIANRLVYGTRATPYEVLSKFSGHVAETYAADEVLPRMAQVLQEGTGAESATVWLLANGELRPAATYPGTPVTSDALPIANGSLPDLPGATRAVEVRHQGELLGALSVSKRRAEGLTPIEERLIDDLAQQAGLVLRNVRLRADLQARLDELRTSRQRLVQAQDEERRRLERNLHDGAQQYLVAIKVKLGLVQMLLASAPAQARATLAKLKGDADEALETLRDLARGIYPPLLADRGLVVALESQARKAAVSTTVEADGVGRYAQDVEATVYFCVLEALQNVQKYARATHVIVRVRDAAGCLEFEVRDDGAGFDTSTARGGTGLTNMSDRMDALGGSVSVMSRLGAGTSVRGELPVAVAAGTAA
jgi:signal transduction histidine kinase